MARHYLENASDGPWTRSLGLYTGWEVMASNGHIIARVIENTHARANANLITSAPDLLVALENLVADWERVHGPVPEDHEARAAIAKAKGQQ